MRLLLSSIGIACAILISGCAQTYSEPKPQTYKVKGKIVFKDGKAYTEKGTIEFQHETTKGFRAMAAIKEDGTFELYTVTAQHRLDGAIEGLHTVTIMPPAPDQNVRTIVLDKKYTVVPGENNLTIEIDN